MCCAVLCLVAQLCPTLCDPVDCSPPGSSVHEILQTRILDGLPCLPPGVLPNPGIKSISLVSCSGWWILHHWHHLGSPTCPIEGAQLVSNSWPSLCLSSFIQRKREWITTWQIWKNKLCTLGSAPSFYLLEMSRSQNTGLTYFFQDSLCSGTHLSPVLLWLGG